MSETRNKMLMIENKIKEVAGIEGSKLNGVHVYFDVKEMQQRVGSSVWRVQPSGRFQINVNIPTENRPRIFRTKKVDGSFDVLAVVDAIKLQATIRKRQLDAETARRSNEGAADTIREKYKLTKTFVSSYAYKPSSFCVPASIEGFVNVQINFGTVDPATAEKIMAFAQSLEA